MNKFLHLDIEKIEIVIFDLDGTLINSEPFHLTALKNIFLKLKLKSQLESKINFLDSLVGLTDRFIYQQYLSKKISYNDFIMIKNASILKAISELSANDFNYLVTPGLPKILHYLKEQKVLMAIVSAGEEEVVNYLIKKLKLDHYISKYFSVIGTHRSKPSASPYLKMMRCFNKLPGNTLIFEDSEAGLNSAIESGARVIRISCNTPLTNKVLFNFSEVENFEQIKFIPV